MDGKGRQEGEDRKIWLSNTIFTLQKIKETLPIAGHTVWEFKRPRFCCCKWPHNSVHCWKERSSQGSARQDTPRPGRRRPWWGREEGVSRRQERGGHRGWVGAQHGCWQAPRSRVSVPSPMPGNALKEPAGQTALSQHVLFAAGIPGQRVSRAPGPARPAGVREILAGGGRGASPAAPEGSGGPRGSGAAPLAREAFAGGRRAREAAPAAGAGWRPSGPS